MRRFTFLLFLVVSAVFSQGLEQALMEYRELVEKQQTLQWFSDERTQPLFKELVADLDKDTRDYLANNIYGEYRTEIEHNYRLKQIELNTKILEELKGNENGVQVLGAYFQSIPERMLAGHDKLMRFVARGLKFQLLNGGGTDNSLSALESLQNRVAQAVDANNSFQLWDEYYRSLENYDIPIWYYDDKNYQILYTTEAASGSWKRVDLNQATEEELKQIPGLNAEAIAKILAWKQAGNQFNNVRQLMDILGWTEQQLDEYSSFLAVNTEAAGTKKKWTIMVYICASNDLERFGVADVNEMEQVGSDENMNIVVQLDRIDAEKHQKNYSDFVQDGNWEKTRRYYVTKDNDPNRIQSNLIEEMDNRDMGSPEELYNFVKYSVDNYPAEKYMVVLWNHGAGWPGIAYDDESGKHLSIAQFTNVFKNIGDYLQQTQNKKGLDIVNMDACLMAMVEVAYELRNTVGFMVGSQEVEPGAGMPYADYLAPLANYPDMTARAMARNMVYKYVQSYTTKGSQSSRYWGGSAVTQSAIDLSKMDATVEAVDQFSKVMLQYPQLWNQTLLGYFYGANGKRYSGDAFIDLYDFAQNMLANAAFMSHGYPKDVLLAAQNIMEVMGVPEKIRRQTDQPVVLTLNQPGYVVWGVDGWKTPGQETWVRGTGLYRSRFAITPLQQVAEDKYKVVLYPFARMKDRATNQPFFPKELNYRFVDKFGNKIQIEKEGKAARDDNSIKRNAEYRVVQHFEENSPIVIEGHTQGMHGSHGLSIYLPLNQNGFDMSYKDLEFSRNTNWDELLEYKPEFKRNSPVLLTDTVLNLPDFVVKGFTEPMDKLGIGYDMMLDASMIQGGYTNVLNQYVDDGTIIMIGLDEDTLSIDAVESYIEKGGRVFMVSPFWIKQRKYQDFFQKHLGATYGGTVERALGKEMNSSLNVSFTDENWKAPARLDGSSWMQFDNSIYTQLYDSERGKVVMSDDEGHVFGIASEKVVYLTLHYWQLPAEVQERILKEVLK
jgi:DNA uptake protein ComE-like DNA-binding protein